MSRVYEPLHCVCAYIRYLGPFGISEKFGCRINNRAESESGSRRADSHVFDGSILLNTKIQFSGSGALGCALLFIRSCA